MTEERRARDRPTGAPLLSLADLESVRLLLRGGSVVDWYRLNFDSDDDAHALVRMCGGDPADAVDIDRMDLVRREAADYLRGTLSYRVPEHLLSCPPMDLFAYASERKGRRQDRFFACMLLKAMHILVHIEARELRYRLPISQSQIAALVTEKMSGFASALQGEGFPLVSYEGGEKELGSLVTKLLVKREHHAAAIHDRVRYRFVVERTSDIVPLLYEMTRRLLPFSYVVPGETINHLVNFTALVESHAAYRAKSEEFQVEIGHEEQRLPTVNEFSGPTYRVINFVADLPVRVPDALLGLAEHSEELGRVIFSLAELQVVDAASAEENETGDNRHDLYRGRQLATVRERLERGLRGVHLDGDDGSA